jgi:hypothetical protein
MNSWSNLNPIEKYHKARRIIFSQALKDIKVARSWLPSYAKKLGPKSYAGLKAELDFFERSKDELSLVLALDIGDATDFVSIQNGRMVRFDITTNLDFKSLDTYEPLKEKGGDYKIAVLNGTHFELIDLGFKKCVHCNEGMIFPTVVLLPENYNDQGESRWSNDQAFVDVCGMCGSYSIVGKISTPFLSDFQTIRSYFKHDADHSEDDDIQRELMKAEIALHAQETIKAMRREYGRYFVAIGGIEYKIVNPSNADGHWAARWEYSIPFVDGYLIDEFEWHDLS